MKPTPPPDWTDSLIEDAFLSGQHPEHRTEPTPKKCPQCRHPAHAWPCTRKMEPDICICSCPALSWSPFK